MFIAVLDENLCSRCLISVVEASHPIKLTSAVPCRTPACMSLAGCPSQSSNHGRRSTLPIGLAPLALSAAGHRSVRRHLTRPLHRPAVRRYSECCYTRATGPSLAWPSDLSRHWHRRRHDLPSLAASRYRPCAKASNRCIRAATAASSAASRSSALAPSPPSSIAIGCPGAAAGCAPTCRAHAALAG